jgi:hypothetical protein
MAHYRPKTAIGTYLLAMPGDETFFGFNTLDEISDYMKGSKLSSALILRVTGEEQVNLRRTVRGRLQEVPPEAHS